MKISYSGQEQVSFEIMLKRVQNIQPKLKQDVRVPATPLAARELVACQETFDEKPLIKKQLTRQNWRVVEQKTEEVLT